MLLKACRMVVAKWVLLLPLIMVLAACNKSADKPTFKVFASPDDAGTALLEAAKSGDQNALLAIFGADSKDIIFSGDAVQDKEVVGALTGAYGVMHRWRKMPDGSQVLLIGADNFAFPIPLKKNAGGQWFYDTAAGKEEILTRRIGRNELAVIAGAGGGAEMGVGCEIEEGGMGDEEIAMAVVKPGARVRGANRISSMG